MTLLALVFPGTYAAFHLVWGFTHPQTRPAAPAPRPLDLDDYLLGKTP